jgi:hypothetical protein
MLAEKRARQDRVPRIALYERGLRGHGPAVSGIQVVEDDNAVACVNQLSARVGAYVAGPAGNQDVLDSHVSSFTVRSLAADIGYIRRLRCSYRRKEKRSSCGDEARIVKRQAVT